MTRVDFYILKKNTPNVRVDFVCRLIEKVYKKGHNVVLHTEDARMAGMMDDLLWTWNQGSFIPHEIASDNDPADCPVVINHNPELETSRQDVLINLGSEVPLFFSQFERVTEIVDQDTQVTQQARHRYRFYKERGYPLESHDIS